MDIRRVRISNWVSFISSMESRYEDGFCDEFSAWDGEAIALSLVNDSIHPLINIIKVFMDLLQAVVNSHSQDGEGVVPY